MAGRVIEAYRPPLLQSLVPSELGAAFEDIDRVLSASPRAVPGVLAEAIVDGNRSMHSSQIDADNAVAKLWGLRLWRVDDLAKLNGLLQVRPPAGIRTTPTWMDAADAADSWFVGPFPDRVPALLTDLVAFINARKGPASWRAVVAAMQLGDIHPFADGNGRTARAILIGVLGRQCGGTGLAARFVHRLWGHRMALMHGAKRELRTTGDWTPVLSVAATAFASARADECAC